MSAVDPHVCNDPIPAPDELEISLFGPGFGECILVHYGDGKWMTIDSCLDKDRVNPTALSYFAKLELDPSECVTHTIITHPDGDHVGGIQMLFSSCKSSRLVCPSVLSDKDMITYAEFFSRIDLSPLTRTTHELVEVLRECTRRDPKYPVYVKQDTIIARQPNLTITALAPSDSKIKKFLTHISQLIPREKTDRRAPGKLSPNAVSTVILVEFHEISLVLGADLEEQPGKGWTNILDDSVCFDSAVAPILFKIAHHGSENADCPEFWGKLDNPIGMLTPFNRGRKKLPSLSDVKRILDYTGAAFSTASFRTQKIRRLAQVDRILNDHGMRRQNIFPDAGQIRIRIDKCGNITHKLFGGAVHLSRVH